MLDTLCLIGGDFGLCNNQPDNLLYEIKQKGQDPCYVMVPKASVGLSYFFKDNNTCKKCSICLKKMRCGFYFKINLGRGVGKIMTQYFHRSWRDDKYHTPFVVTVVVCVFVVVNISLFFFFFIIEKNKCYNKSGELEKLFYMQQQQQWERREKVERMLVPTFFIMFFLMLCFIGAENGKYVM